MSLKYIKNKYYSTKYQLRNYYIFSNIIKYFNNKLITIIKAKKISNYLKNNKDKRQFIFVYDLNVSSIAYGDFFSTLMILRYISIFKKTKLYFINIEKKYLKHHHQDLKKKDKKKRINELVEVANFFLKKKVYFTNYKNLIKIDTQDNLVWEKKKIYNQKPIYTFAINTLHYIYDHNLYKKFIIKRSELKKISIKKIPNKFICLAIKYKSNTASKYRDYNLENIYEAINYLRKKNNKKIMIITDQNTTKRLKKLNNLSKDVIFSKDFGNSFLSDLKICNHSSLFFSLKPSGTSTMVEYSKIPYICFHLKKNEFSIFSKNTLPNDLFYKNKLRHPWQTKKQIWAIELNNNFKNIKILSKGIV